MHVFTNLCMYLSDKVYECVSIDATSIPRDDIYICIYINIILEILMRRPFTPEAETLANYTAEVRVIANILKRRSKRWWWW